MTGPVLVTYATKYGSTGEVAEAVAAALRAAGLEVDVQPMRQARALQTYSAVVLGAPLYIGRWPKDAREFLTRHQAALTERPVAVFSGGALGADAGQQAGVRAQIDKELAHFPWLAPVSVEVVGAKYDPATLHLADGLLAKLPASPLHNEPATDVRDWEAISAWATALAAKLGA